MGIAAQLQASFESEIAVAISSSAIVNEETHICKKCGGGNHWLFKKTEEWHCFDCNPPKKVGQVLRTIGNVRLRDPIDIEIECLLEKLPQVWVAQYHKPTCKCGSNRVKEFSTATIVEKYCGKCGSRIFIDDFFS